MIAYQFSFHGCFLEALIKRDDDELELVKYLFDNYSKEVRPVKNKNTSIEVHFGIAYTQLVELVSCLMAKYINASLLFT